MEGECNRDDCKGVDALVAGRKIASVLLSAPCLQIAAIDLRRRDVCGRNGVRSNNSIFILVISPART